MRLVEKIKKSRRLIIDDFYSRNDNKNIEYEEEKKLTFNGDFKYPCFAKSFLKFERVGFNSSIITLFLFDISSNFSDKIYKQFLIKFVSMPQT